MSRYEPGTGQLQTSGPHADRAKPKFPRAWGGVLERRAKRGGRHRASKKR